MQGIKIIQISKGKIFVKPCVYNLSFRIAGNFFCLIQQTRFILQKKIFRILIVAKFVEAVIKREEMQEIFQASIQNGAELNE